MRDIDFDELDKAVNRFLGKPETEVVIAEEKPAVEQERVEAGVFHENLLAKKDDSIKEELTKSEPIVEPETAEKQPEEVDIIPVKIKTKKREIQDNFSEKPQRAHKTGKPEIMDSLETAKFEEPILEDFLDEKSADLEFSEFEKIMPELKSVNEHSTEDFIQPVAKELVEAKPETEKVEEIVETSEPVVMPVAPAPAAVTTPIAPVLPSAPIRDATPKVAVPQRAGVFQLEDNDDEVVTFGAKKVSVKPVIEAKQVQQDIAKVLDMEKETTNQESVTPVPQLSVETKLENHDLSPASDEKTSPAPVIKNELIDEEDTKTPFVQNVKIEKRPLGSATNKAGNNFDLKPATGRSREIKKAKHKNAQPVEPILSRDEYSQPVAHQKKKSGWLVVLLIMLLVAVFGVAGGIAALYLMNQ